VSRGSFEKGLSAPSRRQRFDSAGGAAYAVGQ
jgi:hypothetical protein